MTELHLLNWSALYLAAAIICLIAATLAATTLSIEVAHEKPWRTARTWQQAVLLVPRLWWRWQKLYWLATPVILAIVIAFGFSLSWD